MNVEKSTKKTGVELTHPCRLGARGFRVQRSSTLFMLGIYSCGIYIYFIFIFIFIYIYFSGISYKYPMGKYYLTENEEGTTGNLGRFSENIPRVYLRVSLSKGDRRS